MIIMVSGGRSTLIATINIIFLIFADIAACLPPSDTIAPERQVESTRLQAKKEGAACSYTAIPTSDWQGKKYDLHLVEVELPMSAGWWGCDDALGQQLELYCQYSDPDAHAAFHAPKYTKQKCIVKAASWKMGCIRKALRCIRPEAVQPTECVSQSHHQVAYSKA